MTTKKLIIMLVASFLLALPITLYLFYSNRPNIEDLGSGRLPNDPSSIERLKTILPVTNEGFSITLNPVNNKIEIEVFEPKNESLNILNTWFAENNFAQIPWESIELISRDKS